MTTDKTPPKGANRARGGTKTKPVARSAAPTQTPASAGNGRALNIVGVIAVIAVVIATAAAIFFGYRAYEARFVDRPVAEARDDAVVAAEQAMINVTTIDPQDLDGWQSNLRASFAGEALKQVEDQFKTALVEPLQRAGDRARRTTGTLSRSAPSEVNADDGTAKVLVYVRVIGEGGGQQTQPATMGFLLGMKKQGDGVWKADTVAPLDGMALEDTGGQQQTPSGGN